MNASFRSLAIALLVGLVLANQAKSQVGNDNPGGASGDFNGSITTAGSYDPYTGNANRAVDDIAVVGSVGSYPLKWVRRMNTRATTPSQGFGQAGGWSHSYRWQLKIYHASPPPPPPPLSSPPPEEMPDGVLTYPDGRTAEFRHPWEPGCCDAADESAFGTSDRLVDLGGGNRELQFPDGGVVSFHAPSATSIDYKAIAMTDPYGLVTTFDYDPQGRLSKVIEPAGRYLEISYTSFPLDPYGTGDFITKVEANDGVGPGHITQTVLYHYERVTFPSSNLWYLTRVDYDDGTHAEYSYQRSNRIAFYPGDPDEVFLGLIKSCNDVRFAGPMKKIQYEFQTRTQAHTLLAWGEIWKEKNEYGEVISELVLPTGAPPDINWRMERRGNATREFHYTGFGLERFTDFMGNESHNNILLPVPVHGTSHYQFTDAKTHMTEKQREGMFGQTILITHPTPEHSTIRTEYSDAARPHYVSSRTDERLNRTNYFRYPDHTLMQINYPNGSFESFTYASNGFRQVEYHTLTNGGVERFQYDNRGLKIFYRPPPTPADGDPDPEQHKSQYIYYDANNSPGRFDRIDRLWKVIDPLGHITTRDYNVRGQEIRVTYNDGTFTQCAYNDDGTLNWTADENHPNAWISGHEYERTQYEYDEYKRVTKITNPLGQFTRYDYSPRNGLGRLSHTSSSVYGVTSPAQKVTEYDYDLNFRQIEMKQAPNTPDEATVTYHYDPVGNLEWIKDPRQNLTTYGYDERNRQTSVTNVSLAETTATEYDPAGNKTKETRPDTAFRRWAYDPMNRLETSYDWYSAPTIDSPAGPPTIYVRDLAGNIHNIIDAKNAIYVFEYDQLNRKQSATYPPDVYGQSRTETWHYDFAGNLDVYKNPGNQEQHFHFDDRNRQDESWWNYNEGPHIVTRHDHASRVTKILATSAQVGTMAIMAPDENSFETMVTFGYDDANRPIWEEQALAGHPTRRIQLELYDDGARRSLKIVDPPQKGGALVISPEMQDSGSYSIEYDYTGRNQVKTIYETHGAWSFDCHYDVSGNRISQNAWIDGIQNSSTNCPTEFYDARNRPIRWEQSDTAGPFWVSHYQYDRAGRIEATWRDWDGRGERFTYDATNQLVSVAYDAYNVSSGSGDDAFRTVDYAYPVNKLNRTSMTDHSGGNNTVITNYGNPSDINQYRTVGQATYDYDQNFNLANPGGQFFSTYDAAKHLITAHSAAGDIAFVYDGLGRCVKRTLNNVVTVLSYDGWKPIAEWDGWADYFQAWNVYGLGPDEILLRLQAKFGYIRFQLDPRGNLGFLIANSGHVVEKYTYDAFGAPTVKDWDGGNGQRSWSYYGHRFQFQGREYLHEMGIYDYRKRFYFPSIGRFLQPDPKGFDAGDANLFRYCGDDPIDGSDPTGEIFWHEQTGPHTHTITVPMLYEGKAATPDVVKRFNAGIASLTGPYFGETLTFKAVTTEHWYSKDNIVKVRPGQGKEKFGKEVGSDFAEYWYAEGASLRGIYISPENGARHSVGHFFGFPEGYNTLTLETYPGFKDNLMDWHPGGTLNLDQVNMLIHSTGLRKTLNILGHLGSGRPVPGAGLLGRNANGATVFNDGGGWKGIGAASIALRWYPGLTGNWQADQTAKDFMMDSGPQAGEGFHPVPFDKE